MRVELAWIERVVRTRAVLVGEVDVAVLDDGLRGEQVVRLVSPVVRRAERVQADRAGVDGEQDEPEDRAPAGRSAPRAGFAPLRVLGRWPQSRILPRRRRVLPRVSGFRRPRLA